MDYLESENLSVATLITDRHSKIAKHMREKYPNIMHYFDLWHLTKSNYSTFFNWAILQLLV